MRSDGMPPRRRPALHAPTKYRPASVFAPPLLLAYFRRGPLQTLSRLLCSCLGGFRELSATAASRASAHPCYIPPPKIPAKGDAHRYNLPYLSHPRGARARAACGPRTSPPTWYQTTLNPLLQHVALPHHPQPSPASACTRCTLPPPPPPPRRQRFSPPRPMSLLPTHDLVSVCACRLRHHQEFPHAPQSRPPR
ncbi:hypothetical protein B0H11DRAFT_560979 [Mycena galericulata]|nr:hypothetical protein B0H11DRAFT_560979 [Mycena galericulata]